MPELPEVETIRRQLAPLVEGRVLERLRISDPRWCLPLAPEAIVDAMQGRRIERLGRRGKYLVWELADDAFLIMHLRMTGTLLYDPPEGTPYERVRFALDDGHELRFCDPRRFGTGELAIGAGARDAFFAARLGLEPLDGELTGPALRAIDAATGEWLELLRGEDLLVLTADHGVDPRAPHTDHTREHAPLLAAFPGNDGRRHDGPLADVGASALKWLAGREAPELPGEPFV